MLDKEALLPVELDCDGIVADAVGVDPAGAQGGPMLKDERCVPSMDERGDADFTDGDGEALDFKDGDGEALDNLVTTVRVTDTVLEMDAQGETVGLRESVREAVEHVETVGLRESVREAVERTDADGEILDNTVIRVSVTVADEHTESVELAHALTVAAAPICP